MTIQTKMTLYMPVHEINQQEIVIPTSYFFFGTDCCESLIIYGKWDNGPQLKGQTNINYRKTETDPK